MIRNKGNILNLLLVAIIFSPNVFAAVYPVANQTDLRNAIALINLSPGTTPAVTANTINISTASILVTGSDLPVLRNGVTINSTVGGTTINGLSNFRLFATYQASLSLNSITLNNGLARGGNGGSGVNNSGGGGGGLGAGGGVYVDLGQSLYLQNLTISGCRATGGAGGPGAGGGGSTIGAGGGGASWTYGLSKNGGQSTGGGDFPGQSTSNSSTGGGVAYPGPVGTPTGYGGGLGGPGGSGGGNRGGNGAAANVSSSFGGSGGYCGGGGGGGQTVGGGGGGNGGAKNTTVAAGGGGGGGYGSGGAGGFAFVSFSTTGAGGGGGGLGGGGGGGASSGLGGGADGGGGGGFGAGGGGGSLFSNGGGGGLFGGSGAFGGSGGGAGGGGGAIGGGIFVGDSAFLYIGDSVNIPLNANFLTAGAGGIGAASGTAFASDIFLFKAATLIFNGSNNQTFATKIQSDQNSPASPPIILDNGIDIQMTIPSAVITLTSTANNYRGGTKVTAGILSVGSLNLPSTGAITVNPSGVLRLTSPYAPAVAVTNSGAIEITLGTFTVPVSFTNTGGALYVTGTGAITGNITTGSSLNVGRNSLGTPGANTLTRTNNNTTVTSTNIYTGSSLVTSGTSTVNSNLYLLGNATFNGTGFSGSMLTTGRDSFNATPDATTTFVASQAIAGFPTITVVGGTFNSNSFAITSVDTAFTVASGAVATINANFAGSATSLDSSNDGILNLNTGATFALAGFTNNAVNGIINFAGVSNNTPITNNGTLNVLGASNSNSDITNNATMFVDAVLNGAGLINNTNGATLELALNAVVSNTINNNVGGIVNITGAGSGEINNAGTLNILQPLDATGDVNNSGLINMSNIINMPGFTLTNDSVMDIHGNQTLDAASFISDGTLNYTITDGSTFDSISANCPINLSDGTVNVTSSFFGPIGTAETWDVLVGTSLTTNDDTIISIPASTGLGNWSRSVIGGNTLQIQYARNASDAFPPPPGVPGEIAQVLEDMSNGPTNSGQQQLLLAVNSASSQSQYDNILNNLEPNTNSSNVNLSMQSIGFNKVEIRVANSKRKKHTNRKKEQSSQGIASGDLTSNSAMWIAGVGSISKQQNNGDNQGYRAKILGGMLGIDAKTANDDVYGIALGISNANVYALENTTNTTRILGYNLMLYGANNFKNDWFAEWIFSGVINKNSGVRVFGINEFDLSTQASYRGALGGARLNIGQNVFLNDIFTLAQIYTLQYILVHQPSYDETGSVAALHVSTRNNSSIITVGTGFRLGVFNDAPWFVGNRELRATFTYDFAPEQTTTANFVVGSSDFNMTSSPQGFAVKLGADCSFELYKKLSLQLSYDYEARGGYYNNFGEIKLRYLF